jgi:hypothetical protein
MTAGRRRVFITEVDVIGRTVQRRAPAAKRRIDDMAFKLLRRGSRAAALALCLVVVGSPVSAQTQKPDGRAPYLDPSLSLDRRVADLVSRMTLEEKVSQMMNAAPAIPRLGIPEYDWWNEALNHAPGELSLAHE